MSTHICCIKDSLHRMAQARVTYTKGKKSWNCYNIVAKTKFTHFLPNPGSFSCKPSTMGVKNESSFNNNLQLSFIQDSSNKWVRALRMADFSNQHGANCSQTMNKRMQVHRDELARMDFQKKPHNAHTNRPNVKLILPFQQLSCMSFVVTRLFRKLSHAKLT